MAAPKRGHLGCSIIGHACDRYIWLTFRWAVPDNFDGRILRLFDTGKREEPRVYEELRAIGVELHTEQAGQQIEVRDESGHYGGSVDGVGLGFPEAPKTWAVLEIKTGNTKSFKHMKDNGVKASKPQHYAQMQAYMGMLKLDRAMYIFVCKETDELWTEWVHKDKEAVALLSARATQTISATAPPARISEDPSNWQCKMCSAYKFCHQGQTAENNCRTCCHASPRQGGTWHCELFGNDLSMVEQQLGCDRHLYIPNLIPSATAIDGGEAHITYQDNATGAVFTDGGGKSPKPRRRKMWQPPEQGPIIDPKTDPALNDDITF